MIIVQPHTRRARTVCGATIAADRFCLRRARQGKRWMAHEAAGAKVVEHDVALIVTLHLRINLDGSASGWSCLTCRTQSVGLRTRYRASPTQRQQIKRLSAAYGNPMKDGGLTVAVMDANDMKAMVQ